MFVYRIYLDLRSILDLGASSCRFFHRLILRCPLFHSAEIGAAVYRLDMFKVLNRFHSSWVPLPFGFEHALFPRDYKQKFPEDLENEELS